jgi:nucleotide-binding universal stress UspA family protein
MTRPPVPGPRSSAEPSALPDRVVVAVSGGRASVRALVWGLRHAAEHDLRVEVVTAWPLHGAVFVREVAGHFCEPRWHAREVQAAAVAEALASVERAPSYELRVVNADLVDALARARNRAVMVVIGSDRPAGDPAARGRLSERVLRAVRGPVVVVGPEVAERSPARSGQSAE